MLHCYHTKAFFGGTFDPIHYGHLLTIEFLAKKIGLNKIFLLPNYTTLHKKKPQANAKHRLNMIKLAIQNKPLFSIDKRELNLSKPSYTVETLLSIRKEIGWKKSLLFIMGKDSFLSLHKWFCWKKILKLCNLIVCNRPGYEKKQSIPLIKKFIKKKMLNNPKNLKYKPYGYIYFAKTPYFNISSTKIRNYKIKDLKKKITLPKSVFNYIKKKKIYKKQY